MLKKLSKLFGAENPAACKMILIQFIKFGLVGISNTAVSMGTYYIFLWLSSDLYMIGSIVGTILSIANAFFWNDKFVFTSNANDWRSKLKRLGKTYVSYGGTSILSQRAALGRSYSIQHQQIPCPNSQLDGDDPAQLCHQQVVDL